MQTPLVVAVALWRVELPKDVELVEGGEDHEDEVPHQQDNPEFLILEQREKSFQSLLYPHSPRSFACVESSSVDLTAP